MKGLKSILVFCVITIFLLPLIGCEDNKRGVRVYDPNQLGISQSTDNSNSNNQSTNNNNDQRVNSRDMNDQSEDEDVENSEKEKPEDYEDEYTECEEYNDTSQRQVRVYILCRNIGTNTYFFPTLRGDLWGVGSRAPQFFSLTGNRSIANVSLWRSSYGTIAPNYDQYGNHLYQYGFNNYQRGPNYANYGRAARYLDDGLYYYENGYWDRNQAIQYFTSPRAIRMCGYSNVLKNLIKSVQYAAFGKISEYVYNILDVVNQDRYGCPYRNNYNTCYGSY